MAPPKGFIPHNKKEVDIEQIKRFYYEYKWDFKKIADFLGFKSKSAIYDRFKKYGLKARTNTDLKKGFKHSKKTKLKISKSLIRYPNGKSYRGYNWISYKGEYMSEQNAVWLKNGGKIPKGFEIHHKNFKKLDNRIENLQLLSHKDHTILHNNIGRKKK